MPKPSIPSPKNQHMAAVHYLGHPDSPPPQTGCGHPAGAAASSPPVSPMSATALPAPHAPNMPSAASLAHGTGSDLMVTWTAPAIDSAHGAAAGFNLRSSPSGAASWATVSGV